MSREYDPIAHATRIMKNDGLCDGDAPSDCDLCFIASYFDREDYSRCDADLAFSCAEEYLEKFGQDGLCISFW